MSEGLRLGLVAENLQAPEVFCALWDGDDAGAGVIAASFGGGPDDVESLQRLWRLAGPGAELAHRLVAAIPLLEVGSYCGKSSVYLGAAAREVNRQLRRPDQRIIERRIESVHEQKNRRAAPA